MPPNPHIGPPQDAWGRSIAGTVSSTARSAGIVQKTLQHELLACDQQSFLTGSVVADLQGCHILNAVRKDLTRKLDVENFLTQQRLDPSPGGFLLDSIFNAILLEASLHVQWDLYGTFCFVPSYCEAEGMLEELRKSNKLWQEQQDASPTDNVMRPLNVAQSPFGHPHWDIIILHPQALLPKGLHLSIAESFNPHIGGGYARACEVPWTCWTASDDRLRSVSPAQDPFPPFLAMIRNARVELGLHQICSLAMVINAHEKLRHFMDKYRPCATPRVVGFSQIISDLVTEIFFVPTGLNNVASHARSLLHDPGQHVQGTTDVSLSQQEQAGQPKLPSSGIGFQATLEEGRMEEASASYREDGFPVVEFPEAPAEDGLTDSEFRMVSASARDPGLEGKRRADAAMLMLFGTRGYHLPLLPCRDYSSESTFPDRSSSSRDEDEGSVHSGHPLRPLPEEITSIGSNITETNSERHSQNSTAALATNAQYDRQAGGLESISTNLAPTSFSSRNQSKCSAYSSHPLRPVPEEITPIGSSVILQETNSERNSTAALATNAQCERQAGGPESISKLAPTSFSSQAVHPDPRSRPLSVHRTTSVGAQNRVDLIITREENSERTTRERTIGERLDPTLQTAIFEKDKYAFKARLIGYALDAAIGLLIVFCTLIIGLAAVVSGDKAQVLTVVLGGLSILCACLLARARASNEPALSIKMVKDLEPFIRKCQAFKMDHGDALGNEYDHRLNHLRDRLEKLLENANEGRRLSSPV